MAVAARLVHDDGLIALDLYPGEVRERIADDPDLPGFDPGSTVWLYWDAQKLDRGEYDFLGIEVLNIAALAEQDLTALERLDLPRVDCLQAGLYDATVAGVLRWAKRAYPGRPFTPRPAAVITSPL